MDRSNNHHRRSGFTLIEMMLVVALLAGLTVFSTPFYLSFMRRNDLSNAARAVTLAVQNAEVHSQGILLDQAWSVRVEDGSVTMFLGADFATRNQDWDITTNFNENIIVSGDTDILFARGTGLPASPKSITLTNLNKETRTITINAKGLVDIQ